MTAKRRRLDRLQNLLILLLVCSALVLIGRTGLFQSTLGQERGLAGVSVSDGTETTALSQSTPVALAAQAGGERYSLQYDQEAVRACYTGGLEDLLAQALTTMGDAAQVSEQDWQAAVSQGENWVFYDFLYNLSFSGKNQGQARCFLLTFHNGHANSLYYYVNQDGYYRAPVDSSGSPNSLLGGMQAVGSHFAFELEEVELPSYQLVRDRPPNCPVYVTANPLAGLDNDGRGALLERLSFNPKAVSIHETADGTLIHEGADSLRLQKNGKLIYHGAENGEARYQALSVRDRDLQRKAEEILSLVSVGQGQLCCQGVTSLGDQGTEVTFYYLLNGARVNLWDKDYGARFVFQGNNLLSYEIFLRDYSQTEQRCAIPPLRQAAAAAQTMGQGGRELQVCYQDSGEEFIYAHWAVRETE
ncbi:MAG: hypothetical protein HFE98_04545 [Ruminiclostridium sp.]|jgi:hypothetical protein|nr:hypothetical protein [Ruminiclostridium sp.]MCI9467001.1 hypothetical protein [Ruminiclostridium sp.]